MTIWPKGHGASGFEKKMPSSSTVIVVSYKPGVWLKPCLESVLTQSDQVIVVDNGSDNEQASVIARSVGARVVRSDKNLGFASGFNSGLKVATGDVIGLLNDDAVAGPRWLEAAAQVLEDGQSVAVTPKVLLDGHYAELISDSADRTVTALSVAGDDVLAKALGPGLAEIDWALPGAGSGRVLLAGKPFYVPVPDADAKIYLGGEPIDNPAPLVRLINHAGSFLRPHGIAGEYGFAAPDDGRFDERAERFGFSGTAPVFSAEGLRRVGGFAGTFFAYNEDTDWCLRARRAGYRVIYDPAATVTHRLSATSGGAQSQFVRFLAERNALLCLLRNAPTEVIKRDAVPRLRHGRHDAVRRSVLRRLPWALAGRLNIRRHQVLTPSEIWDRWADRDTSWDRSPARKRG